ncbi:MAG: KOW domain-containing RNA-binding protein [Clostridiales bacterium]|nr:KOW domain-containing RNA-binding protein [Clostridiales bacterium]
MSTEETGYFVYSLAGHDKGTCYIIMEAEQELVYLVNGKEKKIDSPKKKNKRHIQRTKVRYTGRMEDASIRKAIKDFQSFV